MGAESVSGASSQGSEAASSAGALSAAAMLRAEDDLASNERAFLTSVWGVLFTVSKDKADTPVWVSIFRLFFDLWQLWLLCVNPLYGYDIPAKSTWWRAMSIIQLNDFLSARGYLFYLIALYLMVAGLVMVVALSFWVAHSFQNNNFSHHWPIRLLRGYATAFFQILDIASMTLFLMAMDCHYFDVYPESTRYFNVEFPSHKCWDMPHLVHVAVSAVALLAFIVMAALYQMSDMELNIGTRSLLAMAHTRVEMLGFLVKAFMTCSSVFITNFHWLSVIQLISSAILFAMYLKWVPHYHGFINWIRSATYAIILWSAIMFTILTYHWTADWHNLQKRQSFQHTVTMIMWYGLAPSGLAGAVAAWLRLRYFHGTVLNRFKAAGPDTKPKEIYIFTDPREVEIIARCCRVFIDVDDNLDPAAIKLAEKVVKCGEIQLPKMPFMVIFHSSFLIDVQQSYQAGYAQLQAARKMDPSFLERYAIFIREQQHTQKRSGGGGSGHMDLVAYVEFQRNYNLVLKVHKDALLSFRNFWTQLQHHKLPFQNLADAVEKIDKAVVAAERVYRLVLQRHNNNVKILRLYAKFLEHVKHDPWAAARWFAEADKVELQEEEAKENGILQELQVDPELRDAFLASRPTGAASGGSSVEGGAGVILINAFGSVHMANDGLNAMLGYNKKELHGKSVNLIIPPPFSAQHDGYLRNHMATGRTVITGKVNQMISLHKDGRFIPVRLKVVRISGTGEDAMFLAMMEEMPSPPNTASIWVLPSGMVMSGDAAYTDMCGYKATEVAGMSLAALIKEHKEVSQVLKSAREAFQQDATGNSAPGNGAMSGMWRTDETSDSGALVKTGTLKLEADDAGVVKGAASNAFMKSGMSTTASRAPSVSGTERFTSVTSRRAGRWDGVRVTTTKDAYGRPTSWTIVNISANHKYAEPIRVTVTITNGGIGLHMYHVIKLERSRAPVPPAAPPPAAANSFAGTGPGATGTPGSFIRKIATANNTAADAPSGAAGLPMPPCFMLVADAKGRIAHVTGALAARLGSTPRLIMANGAHRAIESLLMDPWSQLHTKHISTAPPTAFPPFSCRSGLSILLANRSAAGRTGEEGGGIDSSYDTKAATYVPFRMSLKKKIIEEQLHHVAEFKEVKPVQALGERRLLLSMDEHGKILRVSRCSPKSLFGFKPSGLVGRNISTIVDVLKPGKSDEEPSPVLVLAEMAIRAMEAPGISWRVGVMSHDESAAHAADVNTLTGRMKPRSARPAVMRMFVKDTNADFDEEEQMPRYARMPKNHSFDAEDEKDQAQELEEDEEADADGVKRAESMAAQRSDAQVKDSALVLDADDSLDHAVAVMGTTVGVGSSKKEIGPRIMANGDEVDAEPAGNIVIEVELWRADLLLAFLQVDGQGIVTEGSTTWDHMLYDAGLVLGVDPASLEGMRLGEVLPVMNGKPVNELFNPQLSQTAVKKRGALKSSGQGEIVRVSVAHVLEGTHHSDLEPLGLVVQAVRRANGCWVVLRTHQPRCGRHDFKAYLMTMPQDEQMDKRGSSVDPVDEPPAPVQHKVERVESPPAGRRATGARFQSSMNERDDLPSPEPVAMAGVDGPRLKATLLDNDKDSAPAPRTLVQRMSSVGRKSGNKAWLGGGQVHPIAEEPLAEPRPAFGKSSSTRMTASSPVKNAPPANYSDSEQHEGSEGSVDNGSKAQQSRAADDHNAALDASQLDDAENAENMVDDQAYKRGRRFKKLARIMNSTAVQATRTEFRSRTVMLVAFLLLVHIGFFILMVLLLERQAAYVHTLNLIGRAATYAAQVAIVSRLFFFVFYYAMVIPPTPAAQMPAWATALVMENVKGFMDLHSGAFLGYNGTRSRMPTKYGLRDLWESPSLPETIYYKVYVDESKSNNVSYLANTTQDISLFKAGTRFVASAIDMATNGPAFVKSGGSPANWAEFNYVLTNYNSTIAPGYFTAMDSMVSYVIDVSHQVNGVQLIVLAVEGIVLCVLAMAYMAYISNKMAKHRYNMYSVFMTIPGSLIRQLATQRMNLTEEDDEDDDDDGDTAALAAKNAANAVALSGGIGVGRKNSNKAGTSSSSQVLQANSSGRKGFWSSLSGFFSRLRKPNAVAPQTKRQLIPSRRRTVLLMLMFVVWGALVIIMNAVGYLSLKDIEKPISLFNVVNHVNTLYMRLFFYIQEACAIKDPVLSPQYRSWAVQLLEEIKLEYMVMVYGNEVLPPSTRQLPHFAPVKTGIAYSLKEGSDMLFWIRDKCMSQDPTTCPANSTVPYYNIVMNGLNTIFNRFFDIMSGISVARGLDPALSGPEYTFLSATWSHLMGGFQALNIMYEEHTVSMYNKVRLVHIVLLVLTVATFTIFLLFILRPFIKRTASEPRRIAELLSQLPPDVDIESVLQLKMLSKGLGGRPPVVAQSSQNEKQD